MKISQKIFQNESTNSPNKMHLCIRRCNRREKKLKVRPKKENKNISPLRASSRKIPTHLQGSFRISKNTPEQSKSGPRNDGARMISEKVSDPLCPPRGHQITIVHLILSSLLPEMRLLQ